MKKFITICCALFLVLAAFTSCKDVKPEFKFQLELTGDVADATTAIKGDFAVNVTNEIINDFNATYLLADANTEILSIAEPKGAQANEWLENYVQENVINEFSATTDYYIAVKGYVHETLTGLTFSVDKVFTNRPK